MTAPLTPRPLCQAPGAHGLAPAAGPPSNARSHPVCSLIPRAPGPAPARAARRTSCSSQSRGLVLPATVFPALSLA